MKTNATTKFKQIDVYKYLMGNLEALAEEFAPPNLWDKYLKLKQAAQQKSGFKIQVPKSKKTNKETQTFKKSIQTRDCFVRPSAVQGKEYVYQTIFTDALACLKYCSEAVDKLLQSKGTQWNDPQFGSKSKNNQDGGESLYVICNMVPNGMNQASMISWVRPKQIIQKLYQRNKLQQYRDAKPSFTVDGSTSNDIIQGNLPDCWLICALSIVSSGKEQLISGFCPENQILKFNKENCQELYQGIRPSVFHWLQKYGIYVFKFYKMGSPVFVVVDDKIPVLKDSYKYAFGNCRDARELWGSLIEKAYAKLHCNYAALSEGDCSQGLKDLLNMHPTKITIQKKILNRNQGKKDQFWKMLKESLDEGSLIGCSIDTAENKVHEQRVVNDDNQDTGLIRGHAYSLLGYIEIAKQDSQKTSKLLVIRNPWGRGQWKLKWSQEPNEIARQRSAKSKIQEFYKNRRAKKIYEQNQEYKVAQDGIKKDDGVFLICYKDFRNIYNNIYIGRKKMSGWDQWVILDKFTDQNTGDKPPSTQLLQKNPQYQITVTEKSGVYILMQQQDGRLQLGTQFPYQDIHITFFMLLFRNKGKKTSYTAQEQSKKKGVFNRSSFTQLRRDSYFEKQILEPGDYVLIPVTSRKGECRQFKVSISLEKKGKVSSLTGGAVVKQGQPENYSSKQHGLAAKYSIKRSKEVFV